jgi:hypothetical protein
MRSVIARIADITTFGVDAPSRWQLRAGPRRRAPRLNVLSHFHEVRRSSRAAP